MSDAREKVKLVIIGSGPAGYTAAIYAARANLNPVIFEGFMNGSGGQLMTTTDVENFPGFPEGISGPELVNKFRMQAKRFGSRLLVEDVNSVDFSTYPYLVKGKKHEFEAESIIIATGAFAKRLDIPGTRDGEFWQKGVTACAVCDGAAPIFRQKDLYVIGGGDSACEEAIFLTKYARKVFLVHRRHELRASKIMQHRLLNHPGVEVIWDSVLTLVEGNNVVESVTVKNLKTGKETKVPAGGVFFAIGHTPSTGFLNGQLPAHDNGYLKVAPGSTKTAFPYVYACGDVQDHVFRQAITAAGTGCMAAMEAERDLSEKESDKA